MSANCDTCRSPGICCRGFVLSMGYFRENDWREQVQAKLDQHGLPFIPVRVLPRGYIEEGAVIPVFDCPLLGADGRCSDYDQRPDLCRTFEPGSDGLCVEHVNSFKGVPIVLDGAVPGVGVRL